MSNGKGRVYEILIPASLLVLHSPRPTQKDTEQGEGGRMLDQGLRRPGAGAFALCRGTTSVVRFLGYKHRIGSGFGNPLSARMIF